MKRLLFILCSLLSIALRAEGATYYVTSSGSGSTCSIGSPCGSVVIGIGKLSAPDDALNIGAGTFLETSGASFTADGTSGHPILITGAGAGSTIWRRTNCGASTSGCAIQFTNADYVTISGITFKDFSGKTVLDVQANTGFTTHAINVIDCAVDTVGNRGVLDGSDDYSKFYYTHGQGTIANLILTGNAFTGVYGAPFKLNSVHTALVDSNTSTANHASQAGSDNTYQFLIRGLVQLGTGTIDTTVTNNIIHDLVVDLYGVGSVCGAARNATCKWNGGMFYLDAGASNNIVEKNLAYDINTADAAASYTGIIFESGCNGNLAKNNRFINLGGNNVIAMQNGSYKTNANNTNTFDGNATYGSMCSFSAMNTTSYSVKNNIFYTTNTSRWIVGESNKASGGVYTNNLYYNTLGSGSNQTAWETDGSSNCSSPNLSYTAWVDASHTNSAATSLNADPLYTNPGSHDVTLQGGSPAVAAGVGGVDLGAFPDTNPPSGGTITVNYPNALEQIFTGSSINITWDIVNLSGNVKIEASHTSGAAYGETIVSSIAASAGTYAWTVSNQAVTAGFKVKITSLSDPSVFDESDVASTIYGQHVD